MFITELKTYRMSKWVSGDRRFTPKEKELLTKQARAIIAEHAPLPVPARIDPEQRGGWRFKADKPAVRIIQFKRGGESALAVRRFSFETLVTWDRVADMWKLRQLSSCSIQRGRSRDVRARSLRT